MLQQTSFSAAFKKFLSAHLLYLCAPFFTWVAQEICFILKVISFNRTTNRSEYNCPQSFPHRIHAWVASNKGGPSQREEGAHSQSSSLEKAACIIQSSFYNSTFPFNDTICISPAQHLITQNKWTICYICSPWISGEARKTLFFHQKFVIVSYF